jgi:hypothetical protein
VSNIWKHIQNEKLVALYNFDFKFRSFFRYLKALCFLPVKLVVEGFELLKNLCTEKCKHFKPILDYFENYYIGVKCKNKSKREKPMFPIITWNVYRRVTEGRGRADAEIEAWHNAIRSHPTPSLLLEHIVVEQKKTEIKIRRINAGDKIEKKPDQAKLDKQIKEFVEKEAHKCDLLEFFDIMEVILTKDPETLKRNPLDLSAIYKQVLSEISFE